ncbi:MAG: tRNA (adenosine(37)-N6)-dimethylallyltransferase MiaA [Planctomycetota bacterium]
MDPIIVITGATASGKARVAAAVAAELDYPLVSMDSMKVFRHMVIGTAAPPGGLLEGRPVALTQFLDPTEHFSVGQYIERVRPMVEQVRAGEVPGLVFFGGTALYLRMMVQGVLEGPPAQPDIRRRLKDEARRHGTATLHARLHEVDPEAAERIHPNDLKRIERALEVYEVTGQPISKLQRESPSVIEGLPRRLFFIRHPREVLYRRINRRVDRMMEIGLLEEVREVYRRYGQLGKQARHALGYEELAEHLAGRCTLAEAVDAVKQHTRNFAKQQLTWFRNMDEVTAVDVLPEDTPETVARRILELLEANPT